MKNEEWNKAIDQAIYKVDYAIKWFEQTSQSYSGAKFPWYRFRMKKRLRLAIGATLVKIEALKSIKENIRSLKQ